MTLRELLSEFTFEDAETESRFLKEASVTSSRLYTVATGFFSLISLVTIVLKPVTEDNPTLPVLSRAMFIAPLVSFLVPFVVSVVPSWRNRYLYRAHAGFLVLMAVGVSVGSSLYPALKGQPASLLWPISAALYPPILQARLRHAALFHVVHGALAALSFLVVARANEWAASRRGMFYPWSWNFAVTVVLGSLSSVVVSLFLCGWMELTRRRLFRDRVGALRDAAQLKRVKAKSRELLELALPAEIARRAFQSGAGGEVAYAEVADLVGVLVIKFARPYLALRGAGASSGAVGGRAGARAAIEDLPRVNEAVGNIDDLLVKYFSDNRACRIEKVRVSEGNYVAASNVAVPEKDSSGSDPGQRFLALARFAAAAVSVVPGARAGLHIGRCASGILGTGRVAFDIFGDTAARAERLAGRAAAGTVLCSANAHAMIPRMGALWMQSIELQGEPGAPLARAYPLVSLDESALPYEDEPALPHSVPPERIDVAMSSSERDGAATASSLGLSGRSNQSEEPLMLFATSTTARPALYSPLTTRAHRLAAGAMMTAAGASGAVTSTTTPLPGSPPFLPLLPSTAERVEANPWTLIFVDEELEAEFRATFQPEALVRLVSYAAASICAVSFVCELVALDDDSSGGGGVQWPGTVATAVATSVFLLVGSWRLAPPRSDRAELLRMHGALAVGAVALVVALMAPRSRWAEFRLPPLFTYMAFLSCARPSLFPVSVAIMVILASALFIFGSEPSRVVTLAVRSSRIILSVLVAACVTLRYFDERDTRRSFLLTRHCVANRARVMVEVQQIVRVLRSCLPASVLAASLDGHEEQTLSQGSWDIAEALKVDPVDLPEWTLLCCTLCDLPALSARLDHAHLVSLVRHFVLLVEAAAAAEGCEVVRAHGGVVLVSPRIEGAAAGRLAPSSVRDRVARIVRVARAVTEGARGLGPLVSPELELAAAAGIATGHCAGGMIGKLRPSFDLIGPASSMAAFLAKGISSGAAGGVAMCERTKRENGADGTRENAS